VESRADQYRRLAEECLALSRLGGFSMHGRLNLLEMARLWTRLADGQDRAQPGAPATATGPEGLGPKMKMAPFTRRQ
jgi:hypothetical protein